MHRPTLDLQFLIRVLNSMRKNYEATFAQKFSSLPDSGNTSRGHCAVVALNLWGALGGRLVSTTRGGESHWFNRIETTDGVFDVDLTGDQFGLPKVQVMPQGELYEDVKVRTVADVTEETMTRAIEFSKEVMLNAARSHAENRPTSLGAWFVE